MLQVQNLTDVNKALKDLQEQIDKIRTVPDYKGRQIKNVGRGVDPSDVATVGQLPTFKNDKIIVPHYRTILWSNGGTIDGTELEWYRFGRELTSKPIEFWMECGTTPSTNAEIQLEYQLTTDLTEVDILTENLVFEGAQIEASVSSLFISPSPTFGVGGRIRPRIISGGGAANVSFGLVVERIL